MSLPGRSHLVGLIGGGITASLAPPLHERAADRLGLRYLYRPVDLEALPGHPGPVSAQHGVRLLGAARELGFSACNVTHPCKQLAVALMDELSEEASRLGAVNTVLFRDGRMIGHNTDVTGFAAALAAGLPAADLTRVVQLGTGGAGSATAYALLAAGVQRLELFDVDRPRAEERAAEYARLFPGAEVRALSGEQLPEAVGEATGLLNVTPIGMHHHPGAPLDLELVHPGLWVADVIYLPQETPLIRRARALGCPVLPGGGMAVGQAVDAFTLITGQAPDREAMARDFAELVTAQQGPSAPTPPTPVESTPAHAESQPAAEDEEAGR